VYNVQFDWFMDPITHGLTGALLGKAFFTEVEASFNSPSCTEDSDGGRKSALTSSSRVAVVATTLGALFPDTDSLYGVFDRSGLAVISTHRAETHSIVCLPLFALLLAAGTLGYCRWRGIRRPSFFRLFVLWSVGIASHIFLDLITSFGTMIFAPVNYTRYQWDWVFIVDATFTSLVLVPQMVAWIFRRREGSLRRAALGWLLLTLALVALRRWALASQVEFSAWAIVVAGMIFALAFFAPAANGIGFRISQRAWCRGGVALLLAYFGLCALAHRASLARVQSFAGENGIAVQHLAAQPMPPSALRWLGLIRARDGIYQASFRVASQPPQFVFVADAPPNEFIAAARGLPEVKTYFAFARFPLTRYRVEGGWHIVEFSDLRFGGRRSDRPVPFTYRVTLDAERRVLTQGWLVD
jgi:membrane-bound metal-dependent hydrolase YbcI (DUF457 family)